MQIDTGNPSLPTPNSAAKLPIALCLLFLLQTTPGLAIVDMKNANYAVTFIDYQEGDSFQISRTYNSRSLIDGLFGFGWCSDLEDRLLISRMAITYIRCGSGQETLFRRRRTTTDQSTVYFDGPNDNVVLYDGSKFTVRFSVPDGSTQGDVNVRREFDVFGNLTAIHYGRGHTVGLERGPFGLTAILAPSGRRIGVEMSLGNRIRSLSLPDGRRVTYGYDDRDNLTSNRNGWGNTYRFSYDDLHNLVRIDYPDSSFVAVTYDQERDWVVGFRDRLGCVEEYRYQFSRLRPEEHYWADVSKRCSDPVQEWRARHEFIFARTSSGERYLQRVRSTNTDGSFVDLVYDPRTGRPTTLARSDGNQDLHQTLDE